MKDVKIIVGANYGDEGKGLATHYFTQKAIAEGRRVLNVLYNGGSQRGHTVERPDGFRHVFHHFGSGSAAGSDTYFMNDFIVNPMTFMRELSEITEVLKTKVLVSPFCRVTTPYDMILNQIIERNRKDSRHGSCGAGIYETIRRYEHSISNCYDTLLRFSEEEIEKELLYIRDEYMKKEIESMNLHVPQEVSEIIQSRTLLKRYLADLYAMESMTTKMKFEDVIKPYDVIIFEAGQGLALDKNNTSGYPHLTPSNTGSRIPAHLSVLNIGDCNIELCYVTRSYFTRHGAGAFPSECSKEIINPSITDKTNIPNEFQGSLRFGEFVAEDILSRIQQDKKAVYTDIKSLITEDHTCRISIHNSLFVTHLNYTNGDICGNTTLDKLQEYFDDVYTSDTPYADDVRRAK